MLPPILRQVSRAEPGLIQPLSALLIDAVHSGASVGFLAPLAADTAQQYWSGVMAAIGPALVLWVAEQDGRVVGTVQLSLCMKDNGRHRAELQKLLVLSTVEVPSGDLAAVETAAAETPATTCAHRRIASAKPQPRLRSFQTSSLGHCRAHSRVTKP